MQNLRAIALGAALLCSTALSAGAADLYGDRGSVKDGYIPAPQYSSPARWYIRGDVGFAKMADPTMNEPPYDLYDARIDNTWTAGAGVGMYLGRGWRADLTWDHRFETDVHGTAGGAAVMFPGVTRTFGLTSDVFLANVYYDFDMGSRFTPYIGMGLGFTNNKTKSATISDACGCTGTIEGASQTSVAAAFMSGFTINFGQRGGTYMPAGGSIKDAPVVVADTRGRWNLDAGYRLLYLGDAHTGQIITSAGNANDPIVRDMYAHEFRVGLRMDIR